jgi:hypothetical protein
MSRLIRHYVHQRSILPVHVPTTHVIYEATASDAGKLWYLAQLTGQPRLRDRALIADVQGSPAAAISLADDRIVADPYRDTAHLTTELRRRARALRALERTASLSDPMRAGVQVRQ